MNYRTKRILGNVVGGGIAALIVALAAHGCQAHAEGARPTLTTAQAKAAWADLDGHCRGDQYWGPGDNPACTKRDRLGSAMQKAGMTRGDFDVWYTRTDENAIETALWAGSNQYVRTGSLLAGENALVASLRKAGIADDVVVVWWRQWHEQIQMGNAAMYAMMADYVGAICLYHHGDQPYTMEF